MKQTDSINRNKQEYRQIQLIAIRQVQLMKQKDSINRNKHETDSFN